jgi:hypothetical protein
MRKKIGLAIIAAVAFFGIVCAPSGRADEKFIALQTAVSSTTVSGGDIAILTGSSVGNIEVCSLWIFRITGSRTLSSGVFGSRDFPADYSGQA